MPLDDVTISRAIIERFTAKLGNILECDAAVVGGGPAGLLAAHDLARAGRKVVLFERKLALGGGMWGGGMMFNEIVVQDEGKAILDEFGVRTTPYQAGYHCADSIDTVCSLAAAAVRAGATLLNLMSVEDVMLTEKRVTGLVINWTAVGLCNLHVDPLTIRAKYVIDATGHPSEVAAIIQRKSGCRLLTDTGAIVGEKPMHADLGERLTVENTKEFFPGVYAAGMSCNAIFGGPRMGPIFGGMLLSGRKVAKLVLERL